MLVFRACVLSVLLYGCETWTTTFSARHKLRLFYLMCLRVISRVTRWQQQHWHLSNDILREWLGAPDILAVITQHQLIWIGHVARMPQDRLPKQILCAFLPESVGTQRPPGRLKGKWYRQTLVEAMRVAEIPITIWTQFATGMRGPIGGLLLGRLRSGTNPCIRDSMLTSRIDMSELTKLLKKRTAHPDKSFTAAVRRADDWIKAQTSDASGFFKLEDDNAPVPLHTLFESEARAQFGGDWFLEDFDDVFTRVMDTPFWEPAVNHELDLGLLRLVGLTAYKLAHDGSHLSAAIDDVRGLATPLVPIRRRMRRKQRRTEAFRLQDEEVAAPRAPVVRMRTKYWTPPVHASRAGAVFACQFPGCTRSYTTKSGLGSHVVLKHTAGTYREQGWDCPHCCVGHLSARVL